LPIVAAETHHIDTRILLLKLLEEFKTAIGAPIVDKDDLIVIVVLGEDLCETLVQYG